MKKRFGVISVLLAALLVAGCVGAPKTTIYDKSVPLEKSSTLIISMGCSVIEFDGKSTLSPSWQAHNSGMKQMIIPAGTHTLKLYTEVVYSGAKHMIGSEPMTLEFLQEHSYVAMAEADLGGSFIAVIIDQAELSRELIPDPTRADASPFEGVWVNVQNEEDRMIFSGNKYMVLSKTKGQFSWRGTFSHNNGTITLNESAYETTLGWLPWPPSEARPIRFVYNGTTLKGRTFPSNKNIEFRKAQ
jgi:hypothetical protein